MAKYSVLLVDDDPSVLATTEALLADLHDVTTASSADEAFEILASRVFDVVCSDHSLGRGPTGLDVLANAAQLSPTVGRILITGHPPSDGGAGYYALTKPCDPARLLEIVERAGAQAVALRRSHAARVRPASGRMRTVETLPPEGGERADGARGDGGKR